MTTIQAIKQAFGMWMKSRGVKMVGLAFILIDFVLMRIGLFIAAKILGPFLFLTMGWLVVVIASLVVLFAMSYWLRAATLASVGHRLASICSPRVARILFFLPGMIILLVEMGALGFLIKTLVVSPEQLLSHPRWQILCAFLAAELAILAGDFYVKWRMVAASSDGNYSKGSFRGFFSYAGGRLIAFFLLSFLALSPLLALTLFGALWRFAIIIFSQQIGVLFMLVLYREYHALPARKR